MESPIPISIDPILNYAALYNKTKKSLSIVDMANSCTTMASYTHQPQMNTSINMNQCWTYVAAAAAPSRKRSHNAKRTPSLEVTALENQQTTAEYFICCNEVEDGSTKKPSIQINSINKKQSVLMEMSHQGKPSSITTMVVHPFERMLFTGCNDGTIVRWCFGEKQLTKIDYTCPSNIIAMAINTHNNTLIFMEQKASTIHITTIGKSLTKLSSLKNDWNSQPISMKIMSNNLFGLCGSNSLITLFKNTPNQSTTDDSTKASTFVKFHSMNLKNNVADFDIVEYNKLYYLAILNGKRTSLSIYPLQNIYNANATNNNDSIPPLYTVDITCPSSLMNIIKIKLVAQTAKHISPMCLLYYTTTTTTTTTTDDSHQSNIKMAIIYLDDLKWGKNDVAIGNRHEVDTDKLKPILSHMATIVNEQTSGSNNTLNDPTNQGITGDAAALPTTKTLVQTLTQVINSNDNRLLEDIINRTSTSIIDNSIGLLSSPLAYRLLSLLTDKIEANPSKSSELTYWIKSILSHHVSFFSTILANNRSASGDVVVMDPLQKLQNIMEFRSHFYQQLCEVQGRVSVLISRVKREKTFDKQRELEAKLIKPIIKIDENNNDLKDTLPENLMMDHNSSNYSDESGSSDIDMLNMDSEAFEEMESVE